ncbi:MAG: restriction endonuclease subunit S [Anaerolineales bacterium]|nr:restriction endonuclease subunit S [Anaerolineales bacterium]MDW8163083.1 restriction endonuclease subunit S [Anaerolineales bacterium]
MNQDAALLPNGYRMTDLGPLPEEWRVVRLGDVFNPIPKRLRQVRVQSTKTYRMLTVRLYAKGVTLRAEQIGAKIGSRILFEAKAGDFVFSKIDARNGAWGFVPECLSGALVSNDFPMLTLSSNLAEKDFVEFALSRPAVWIQLRGFAVGTTNRRRLQVPEFLKTPIPLPPLPEQRAIAHVLRTVQAAKEAGERVVEALRALKKSLMRHLFTYGPVPIDAVEHVPLRDTELGPLPAHWQVVRLGEVFEIQQGKSLSPKSRSGPRMRPFLRTVNVLWGRIDLTSIDEMHFEEAEEDRLALKPGDLLVCEGGDIGRTAIWEGQLPICLYQNHLHRLRARGENTLPTFYMYWMQHAWTFLGIYSGAGNKTTIPNLSRSRLSSFLIPLPPLAEQREIARILQAVDRRIQAEEAHVHALEALFRTLLHELMTARRRLPAEFIAKFASHGDQTLRAATPTIEERSL